MQSFCNGLRAVYATATVPAAALHYITVHYMLHCLQVPEAWSKLQPENDQGKPTPITTINIQQNQLEGPLPVSLSSLEQRLEYLYLDGNPQLSGCVPLTPYTTVTFTGTQVAGRCAGSSAKDLIHKQQRQAISTYFLQALGVNVDRDFRFMLRAVVTEINNTLGASVQPGQVSKTFQQNHPQGEQRGFCKVSVALIDGIEYITGIEVGATDQNYPAAGLNMRRLLPMLQQLPRLRVLDCRSCYLASEGPIRLTNRLPDTLPSVAPNLAKLALTRCGLVGPVPRSYGNWTNMEELFLDANFLTGRLPSELAKLKQLKVLFLASNGFNGKRQHLFRARAKPAVLLLACTSAAMHWWLRCTVCVHSILFVLRFLLLALACLHGWICLFACCNASPI